MEELQHSTTKHLLNLELGVIELGRILFCKTVESILFQFSDSVGPIYLKCEILKFVKIEKCVFTQHWQCWSSN